MEQFRNLRTRGSKLHECYELKDSIKGFCLLRHGPLKRSEREHFFRFERARNMWRARVEKKKEGATQSPCPSFSPLHSIHLHILLRQSGSFSRRRSLFLCFSVLFHLSHSISYFLIRWAVVLTTRVYFLSLFPPTSLERGTMKLQIDGTLHEEVVQAIFEPQRFARNVLFGACAI